MRQEKSARDSTIEGYEEHHVADVLMREISRLSPSDEKWKAKFAVLKENVEHHVEEEEGEIWTKAQEVFDEAEARSWAKRLSPKKKDGWPKSVEQRLRLGAAAQPDRGHCQR